MSVSRATELVIGPLAVDLPLVSGEKVDDVAETTTPTQLGFLTILHETSGYLGGYLVTNLWGRPLEFRLSTAVQPNRVQQILYGPTLPGYVHADLIGKTLVEKTGTPATLIVTDRAAVLDLRNSLKVPVVWVAQDEANPEWAGIVVRPAHENSPALVSPQAYPDDVPRILELLNQFESGLDLREPFGRIREAISEARKLGVTNRG